MKFFNFDIFLFIILDFFEFFAILFNFEEALIKKGTIILLAISCDLNLYQSHSSLVAFSLICLLITKNDKHNIDYNEIFSKLDSLYDNKFINKSDISNDFLMLLKPLKNIEMIKIMEESILNLIKNIKKKDLINLAKKIKKNNIFDYI